MSRNYAYFFQELEHKLTAPEAQKEGQAQFTSAEVLSSRELPENLRDQLSRRERPDRSEPEARRYFAHLDEPTSAAERLEKDVKRSQQLHRRIQQRKGGR